MTLSHSWGVSSDAVGMPYSWRRGKFSPSDRRVRWKGAVTHWEELRRLDVRVQVIVIEREARMRTRPTAAPEPSATASRHCCAVEGRPGLRFGVLDTRRSRPRTLNGWLAERFRGWVGPKRLRSPATPRLSTTNNCSESNNYELKWSIQNSKTKYFLHPLGQNI